MLKYLILIVIAVLISLLVRELVAWLLKFASKKSQQKQEKQQMLIKDMENDSSISIKLKFNIILRWVFIILAVSFVVVIPILIYCFPEDVKGQELEMSLAFIIPFGLPCLFLAYIFNSWKIVAYQNYFYYKSFFGKKSKFFYNELTLNGARIGDGYYFTKDEKRVATLPAFFVNCKSVIDLYKKENKKLDNKKG